MNGQEIQNGKRKKKVLVKDTQILPEHARRDEEREASETIGSGEQPDSFAENAGTSFVDLASGLKTILFDPKQVSTSLQLGWALPGKRIVKRFDADIVAYLQQAFDEGVQMKKKKDPRQVEQQMKNALNADGSKRLTSDQLLTHRQIASFFTIRAAKLRQQGSAPSNPSPSSATLAEEMNSEQGILEEELDTEPTVANEYAAYSEAVQENIKNIFETD